MTELITDSVGLGNVEPMEDEPSVDKKPTKCEPSTLEEEMVIDGNDKSEEHSDSIKIEMYKDQEAEMNASDLPLNKVRQEYCVDTVDDFKSNSMNVSSENEDLDNSAGDTSKLLSEISELIHDRGVEDTGEKADEAHNIESLNEVLSKNDEREDHTEMNNIAGATADGVTVKSNVIGGNDIENTEDIIDGKSFENDTLSGEVKKPKESAIQKLASLGLIAAEEPVVEDKETILKKLASRGGISIMPTGSSPSVSSPISINQGSVKPASLISSVKSPGVRSVVSPNTVTSVLPAPASPTSPSYKPGPKSTKKKIKIDPGKSLDIDKDFNSLINFLSSGADVSSNSVTSSASEEINVCNDTVSKKIHDSTPISNLNANETSNHSIIDVQSEMTNDGVSGMDVDTNDDKFFLESESESHDGSKCGNISENDDKTPTINKSKSVIEEGSAEILLSTNKNVFYNKVQEFNRDMSIAALTVFSEMHQQDPRTRNRGKKRKVGSDIDSNPTVTAEENVFQAGKKAENGITILEALSATGLRSIRYAREIPGVKEVIANDLSEDAVDTIKKNIKHNGVENIVTTSKSDASLLMYQRQAAQEWYDAVDLDPYGCPSRFLDAAVQAVRDGGLLLVTCTDMAVLAGNSPETCYVKYGSVSLRMPACHEMALRIALQCIESHANRYGRYIVPLLSFSADFYIRLIVQVYTSPVTCKRTTSKLAMVYQCVGCGTHTLQPLGNITHIGPNSQPKLSLAHGPPVGTTCLHCHHKHHMGGPVWTGPLYSPKFVESMLTVAERGRFGTAKRMEGMLEVIREELQDVPLYYTVTGLCSKLHCQTIPLIDIRSAILNAGYRVSSSHATPTAIKTNAPSKVIWDIMRCWVHMNPVSQRRLLVGSVPAAILLEPPNLIANFDIHPRARSSSATRNLLRYQQNPEKNWGPGMRARCNNAEDTKDEKRRLNQNKNKNKKHVSIIEVVTIDDEDEMIEETEKEKTQGQVDAEQETTQRQADDKQETTQRQADDKQETTQRQADDEQETTQRQADAQETTQRQADAEQETTQRQADADQETIQRQMDAEQETTQRQADAEQKTTQRQADAE